MNRTVRDAVADLSAAFREAGLETPERDARLLVAAAIEGTAEDILRTPERGITSAEATRITAFRQRRLAREPVSRIVGHRGFFGRTFLIGPATLDPRPETETLIEEALEICRHEDWTNKPIRILDIGTGSGCNLLTLLCELPRATGTGTDISQDALDLAARNAQRLKVDDRASFRLAHTWENGLGPFDLVLSNPPYIPSGEIAGLQPEVRDYDPRGALDGGGDGLAIYREIAAGLVEAVPDAWVVLETGAGQSDAVLDLLRAAGGASIATVSARRDLGGHTRCVAVRTHPLLGTH